MAEILEVPIEKVEVAEHDIRMQEKDDAIDELAASIRNVGILVPLIVRSSDDKYVLIAGHRRLQAAKKAGFSNVPVICRTGNHAEEIEVSFAENFFRKDLSPVELACAIKDSLQHTGMTEKKIAAGFHKSVNWVQRMVAITLWPDDVLEAIHTEMISVSAAANLAIVTDENYRRFLVRNAIEQGATARTTAAWLQAWQSMQPMEEAITAEPVDGRPPPQPAVPQAPCLCCGQVFNVNQMSHVPVCGACVQIIRQVGSSAG